MTLPLAISQIGYPGAGDVDDCWVVATIWAAKAAGAVRMPTVPEFRAAAGNPDRPGPTGGDLTQIMRATPTIWPELTTEEFKAQDWPGFLAKLRAGWIASLAVLSSFLPADLRYNFYGSHQIGVAMVGDTIYVMNPLMKNGAILRTIAPSILRSAALVVANGWVLAALFKPKGGATVPNVTTVEAVLAQRVLRKLGADPLKPAMVRAVVAWFRQESGLLSRVVGNNPFNIKAGAASKLSSGTSSNGFLIFPSMAVGFEAAAAVLLAGAPAHGYGTVLTAVRNNDALQFLAALARSQWSESHYGWVPGANPRDTTNHLVAGYVGLRILFTLH